MPLAALRSLIAAHTREILEMIGGGALIALVLVAINLQVVDPAFRAIEERQAVEDSDRAVADLEREIQVLAGLARDWAGHDGLCVPGGALPDAARLSAESDIDLIACYDANGRSLGHSVHHPLVGGPVVLRALIGDPHPVLASLEPVREHALPRDGLFATEHGLLLLAARPLPAGSVSGRSPGLLLLGRFFTRGDVILLSERTRVRAELLARDQLQGPERELFDRLAATGDRQPAVVGSSAIRLLTDIDRNPIGVLRSAVRDNMTVLGRQSGQALSFLLGSVALVLLLFLVVSRSRARESRRALAASEARERQLQKEKSLGRMAAAIAHHFNNQLTAVIGFIQLAMHRPLSGDSIDRDLTEALRAAERAAELSGLMLTYLGQSMAARHPVDLAACCRRCLPELQLLLPAGLNTVIDFPEPGPMVLANDDQIRQVLVNLAVNAAEAVTGEAGRLELSVSSAAAAEIATRHRFPADWQPQEPVYARLAVTDNGCGIDPADKEHLFDPFFTRKFTGRGLGLAVVLGLAKAGGGVVTVRSEPGQGSEFAVYLPLVGHEGGLR